MEQTQYRLEIAIRLKEFLIRQGWEEKLNDCESIRLVSVKHQRSVIIDTSEDFEAIPSDPLSYAISVVANIYSITADSFLYFLNRGKVKITGEALLSYVEYLIEHRSIFRSWCIHEAEYGVWCYDTDNLNPVEDNSFFIPLQGYSGLDTDFYLLKAIDTIVKVADTKILNINELIIRDRIEKRKADSFKDLKVESLTVSDILRMEEECKPMVSRDEFVTFIESMGYSCTEVREDYSCFSKDGSIDFYVPNSVASSEDITNYCLLNQCIQTSLLIFNIPTPRLQSLALILHLDKLKGEQK